MTYIKGFTLIIFYYILSLTVVMAQSGFVGLNVKAQNSLRCEKLINTDELESEKANGKALDINIKKLCQQKQRNKAQNLALEFANKIQKSKVLLSYRACHRQTQKPFTPLQTLLKRYFISNLRFVHVCDSFNTSNKQ